MSLSPSTVDVPITRRSIPTLGRRMGGSQARRGIAIGFALPYLAGRIIGPWADPILPLALGVAFVTSVATGRPLIATIAARRPARSGKPAIDFGSPRVRRVFARITLGWGTVMLAEAGAIGWLVADQVAHLGTINTIVSLAVPAVLIPVTVAYARRSVRALASGR